MFIDLMNKISVKIFECKTMSNIKLFESKRVRTLWEEEQGMWFQKFWLKKIIQNSEILCII